MNTLAWYRINSDIRFMIFIAVVIGWLLGNLFPYTRIFYAGTKAVDNQYGDFTGYPAGEGYDELTTWKEVTKEHGNYVLKVDVSNLKPVKVYGDLKMGNIEKGKFHSKAIGRFGCSNWNRGVGRFFETELSDGNRICIFLDDHSVKIPSKGIMTLPLAKTEKTDSNLKNLLLEKTELSEEEASYFVDAAGEWRKGKEGNKAYNMIMIFSIVIMLVLFIGGHKFVKWMNAAEVKRETLK